MGVTRCATSGWCRSRWKMNHRGSRYQRYATLHSLLPLPLPLPLHLRRHDKIPRQATKRQAANPPISRSSQAGSAALGRTDRVRRGRRGGRLLGGRLIVVGSRSWGWGWIVTGRRWKRTRRRWKRGAGERVWIFGGRVSKGGDVRDDGISIASMRVA